MKIDLSGPDWICKGYIGADWLMRRAHLPETRDRHGWAPATVPGSVHYDLLQAGEIPDPYMDLNSLLSEWVPQRAWVYKKTFRVGEDLRGKRLRLYFAGVDYEAEFFLNGARLGQHRGMFTPAVFEVGEHLKFGGENLISVVIAPAPQEQPQVGYTSQVRTIKTRMNYWWDFCPRIVHQGIWDRVYLEATGPVRIEDLFVRPLLAEDLASARVKVQAEVSAMEAVTAGFELDLSHNGQTVAVITEQRELKPGLSTVELETVIEAPQLWWPNGAGEAALYQAELRIAILERGEGNEVKSGGEGAGDRPEAVSVRRMVQFGIRKVELIPNDADRVGARRYTLRINHRRVYLRGWNWTPMDALYGVERPEKLHRLLELARRANVNLLRVWGGGLIEKEAFYAECDRLGIMVWQEFIQSSSGQDNDPPHDPDWVETWRTAARPILRSRRNHPSLILWCGGNELQDGNDRPLDDAHPLLAALKAEVTALDPDRLWLPTSPTGPVFMNSLENLAEDREALHDVHGPWEHQGLEGQFRLYNQGSSLLHSEFGVEGITNLRTLYHTVSPELRQPVSLENPVWFHRGAWWVKEERWREMLGETPELEQMVRAVQFLQADGLRYAVEADRRRQFENSGTLPWQFNEPFPMAACTSAVDYYARPKPAYYAVAQAYVSLHVSARFERQAWEGFAEFTAQVWVSSALAQEQAGLAVEAALVGASGKRYTAQNWTVSAGAEASAAVGEVNWGLEGVEPVFFLDLFLRRGEELIDHNRYIFSREANLAPLLALPPTSLHIQVDRTGGEQWRVRLENAGETTALFVVLEDTLPLDAQGGAYFSANHFCLLPGEPREVQVDWEGVPGKDRYLQVGGWNTLVEEGGWYG